MPYKNEDATGFPELLRRGNEERNFSCFSAIVDAVVAKVEERQDLRLKQVLDDFTGGRLSKLVMRQIELSDSIFQLEARDKGTRQG